MPRKKKTTTTATPDPATVPQAPTGGEEKRCFQVTLQKDGLVAGTERQWLTKQQALDQGFVWSETDPTKRRKKNTGDGG
jgi:hypothetical protein